MKQATATTAAATPIATTTLSNFVFKDIRFVLLF